MKKLIANIFIFFFVIIFLIGMFLFALFSRYPLSYKTQIKNAATKYNIKSELVASIIKAESGFDQYAKSKKGALGLMQILPSTAKWICQYYNIDFQDENQLFDPQTNILIGCQYLVYLFEKFQNTDTALCAYNAGEGVVKNWLANTQYSEDNITLTKIPFKETENYLQKIHNNLKVYKYYY